MTHAEFSAAWDIWNLTNLEQWNLCKYPLPLSWDVAFGFSGLRVNDVWFLNSLTSAPKCTSEHLLCSSGLLRERPIPVANPDVWTIPNNIVRYWPTSCDLPPAVWKRCGQSSRVDRRAELLNEVILYQGKANKQSLWYSGTVGLCVSIWMTNWRKHSKQSSDCCYDSRWQASKGYNKGFLILASKAKWHHLLCPLFQCEHFKSEILWHQSGVKNICTCTLRLSNSLHIQMPVCCLSHQYLSAHLLAELIIYLLPRESASSIEKMETPKMLMYTIRLRENQIIWQQRAVTDEYVAP